jgi:hypothetical protein
MHKRLESILCDDDYETLVACDGDDIVGFIGMRVGALSESLGLLVLEKRRSCGGSIESIPIEGDSLREEQLNAAAASDRARPAPTGLT